MAAGTLLGPMRRELRLPREVSAPELRVALAEAKPHATVLPVRGGFRLEAAGRRVRVLLRPWRRLAPGRPRRGTRLVIAADYPRWVWWWLVPGVVPVLVAQRLYDRKVGAWTATLQEWLAGHLA